MLLSAGSSYLERVLSVTTSEHPTIVLSSIRYKELKLLVDFMYSGEVAVAQTQFPGLMEAANWLGIRGLCTEEEREEEEEGSKEEVTVTTNESRKRQHSDESEEEEEEEQILGPDEDQVDVNPSPGKQLKQQTYGSIQGVNNAVWMMKPDKKQEDGMVIAEEEKDDQKSEEMVPDLVRVAGPPVTAPPPNLSPCALNEQLLQVKSTHIDFNFSALYILGDAAVYKSIPQPTGRHAEVSEQPRPHLFLLLQLPHLPLQELHLTHYLPHEVLPPCVLRTSPSLQAVQRGLLASRPERDHGRAEHQQEQHEARNPCEDLEGLDEAAEHHVSVHARTQECKSRERRFTGGRGGKCHQ